MSRYFLELRFSIIDLYTIDVYNNIEGLISICVLIDYYHQVLNVFDTCNRNRQNTRESSWIIGKNIGNSVVQKYYRRRRKAFFSFHQPVLFKQSTIWM